MKLPPAVRKSLLVTIILLVAISAQAVWANSMTIHGAHPDITLVAALLCSQFCSANEAAAVGFAAGIVSASMASPPAGGFGSIVVSRTVVCCAVGWLEERVFRDNPVVALAVVGGGTAIAEILFFIFDPQRNAWRWGRGALLELAYNAALALPVYLIVRYCLRSRQPVLSRMVS